MNSVTVENLTNPKFLERLKEQFFDYLPKIGVMALIVAAGLVFIYFINRIARRALSRTKIDPSLADFLRRVLRIACYVLLVFMALSELGVATTGLVAFFSAALAAVALALKDSLSDITSGIILLFTRPFVTGDHIEFDGCRGTVLKIDIVHTNIVTYDDTNVIIPNSRITSSEIINYTSHPESRVTVTVPIPYEADIDRVKAVLLETMRDNELVLDYDPYLPRVQLERYADSSLEFSARCWTNFKNYWTVYYSLTEEIKKNLDRCGVSIPFNQLDVHICR
ncbi:MAG: mechanosensitive ion channel family protein [Clostridia bacterium]|nr:mechanosensitive ion channel family protein [Clostridia bacterium]